MAIQGETVVSADVVPESVILENSSMSSRNMNSAILLICLAMAVNASKATDSDSASSLATIPNWIMEGDQFNCAFGYSVASAGDVNGDGYSDVIVGAPMFSTDYLEDGRAIVYHGSASGLLVVPAWTAKGESLQALFGLSVASAGDVNGDGFSDIIVGSPTPYTEEDGAALVYHGSPSGLSATPAWTAQADVFGSAVASAGDVNADGYDDVIVGAFGARNSADQNGAGKAFLYYGSPLGLSSEPGWTIEGDHIYNYLGYSVASAGDVNGDGYDDVLVGAPSEFNGFASFSLYFGSLSGLQSEPAITVESQQYGSSLGTSVASAGDVNGDGFGDVIVGDDLYLADPNNFAPGAAYVYCGSASGLDLEPAWSVIGDQHDSHLGWSVATAGDVDDDGFSDVIISAPIYDNTELHANEGIVYLYRGSDDGLSTTPAWISQGDQMIAQYGNCVATAGDVNCDGLSDIVVGHFRYDESELNEGRALVFHGLSSLPSECDSDIAGATGSDADDITDVFDLLMLLTSWGTNGPGSAIAPPEDIVDALDLLHLLNAWGECE